MNKLELNKKTIAILDKSEMGEVKGGFLSIISCRASKRGTEARCCDRDGNTFPDPC